MKPCLNASLIGWKQLSLVEWLELAARTGWPAAEFNVDEVAAIVAQNGAQAARDLFSKYHVEPAVFGLPTDWRAGDAGFEESLEKLPKQAEAAAAVGCKRTCTWMLPTVKDVPVEEHSLRLASRFKQIAKVLAHNGISCGIEFIGPHHFLQEGSVFVRTMEQMLEWERDAIGEPNMGLLLDSYHWYTTDGTPAQIAALKPEKIVHVHINDAKPLPVEELHDGDRLLHGEGVIDLVSFLWSIKQTGYDGPVAAEPLGRKLSEEMGVEGAARHARVSLDALMAKAGV